MMRCVEKSIRHGLVAFHAAAEPDWWSFAVHLPANAEYAFYHSSQVDHYATAQNPDALVVIHDWGSARAGAARTPIPNG